MRLIQLRAETDLKTALAEGVFVEGHSFDAKASLPPSGKNKDLAKDICAMTIDGRALLSVTPPAGSHTAVRPLGIA